MTEQTLPKLIHVARIQPPRKAIQYLYLRKKDSHHFIWFQEDGKEEKETPIDGATAEEAIQKAYRYWKNQAFRMVNCGFRYTLPERDEHGYNALFHQMAASYATPNGIYFDEEAGNNCFVNFASEEAKNLLSLLKQNKRL